MKAVILAGGRGTRICEETVLKPKPMVRIGEMPILWHIMKIYSSFGINDFIICLGYKGEVIKEFFANYELWMSDVTFDMAAGQMTVHKKAHEPWRVTLIDTGLDTATGGRLKRIREYIQGGTFCFTYGDGLSDVDVSDVIRYHRRQGRLATMTVCRHISRFGILNIGEDGNVKRFSEKPAENGSWMNSGFFVAEPDFLDYIEDDETVLERGPLEKVIQDGQLAAYQHEGFFRGMDSMRDRQELEKLWHANAAPWKKWNDADRETYSEFWRDRLADYQEAARRPVGFQSRARESHD